jgi:16S rRNA processing protein RimM
MGASWIEVGVIGRPHGVRGALHVFMHNPDSALLKPGATLWTVAEIEDVASPDGESPRSQGSDEAGQARRQSYGVEWAKQTPADWLVKFIGIDERDVAAALTNHRLLVSRDQLPALDEDDLYEVDLVGLIAIDQTNRRLGTIVGFFDNGAHEVCVIQTGQGNEVYLPFHPGVLLGVDEDGTTVRLDIPEGIPGLESPEE